MSTTNTIQPDRITIRETFVEDVSATGALLTVTVKGSSFITGQTALKKAREVATLVEALITAGLSEAKISVETVKVQASSGPILKTSSASYTLRLDCEDLEKLDDVLTVVTSAKNISLDSLEWQYADLDTRKNSWITAAIEQANSRAREATTALGVQIAGVQNCQIEYIGIKEPPLRDPDKEWHQQERMRVLPRTPFSIGMPMQQSEEKGARVTVVYHITK
jgi:uncharacterized protein YggE